VVFPLALPTIPVSDVVEFRLIEMNGLTANDFGDLTFFLPTIPSMWNRYFWSGLRFVIVHVRFLPGLHFAAFPPELARTTRFFVVVGALKVMVTDLLPGFSFVTMKALVPDFKMSASSSATVPSFKMR
jgi:hypothetical protein